MEVQLKGNPNRRFHLPTDIADLLLLWPGTPIEAIPPPPPERKPDSVWGVTRGVFNEEPQLTVTCRCCKNQATYTGPTAHQTQHFSHCGVNETPPTNIAKVYEKLAKEFYRRVEAEKPSWLQHEQFKQV